MKDDDLKAAEDQVSKTLNILSDATEDDVAYYGTKAVCEAILAVGIRLELVAERFYNAMYLQGH